MMDDHDPIIVEVSLAIVVSLIVSILVCRALG